MAAFLAEYGEELVPPAREFLIRAGLANWKFRFELSTLGAGWEQIKNITMRPLFYIVERRRKNLQPFPWRSSPSACANSDEPSALPAHLAALRDKLRPAKPLGGFLSFDDARVDACLGGGLPWGQLHEIGASGLDAETAALPAGFIASLLGRIAPARPVFWIAPVERPAPAWAAALRARSQSIGAGASEEGQRHARSHGGGFAGRCRCRGGGRSGAVRPYCLAPVAACLPASRLHRLRGAPLAAWAPNRGPGGQRCRYPLAPHPDAQREGCQGARLPRWHVALTHVRGGRPGEWIMEASDDATHPLRVVAALADHAPEPQRFYLTG